MHPDKRRTIEYCLNMNILLSIANRRKLPNQSSIENEHFGLAGELSVNITSALLLDEGLMLRLNSVQLLHTTKNKHTRKLRISMEAGVDLEHRIQKSLAYCLQ